MHLNGEDIKAIHFPHGHTDGDAVIFFPQSNVVHMGDDFVTYGFPFVDLAAGGSVKGLVAGLEAVVAQLPPDVKVIPGHGKVSTLDDVRRFIAMVKDSRAAVEKALAAGRTVEQMKASGLLDPWKSYGPVPADQWLDSVGKWLETIVNELEGLPAEYQTDIWEMITRLVARAYRSLAGPTSQSSAEEHRYPQSPKRDRPR